MPLLTEHGQETDQQERIIRSRRGSPLAVDVERREPGPWGPSFTEEPDDNRGSRYSELNVGWHEAPDPVRQSDFYAEGNKIHPNAQMRIVSHLAMAKVEAVMDDTFHIGKLLGYMYRPMYAKRQKPSVVRTNIAEALPQTYGSMYNVSGIPSAGQGVITPTGFQEPVSGLDGDPYW